MNIQIDKASANGFDGGYKKDGKRYATIRDVLDLATLGGDSVAQKSLASSLQDPQSRDACLTDIGKFLDSRGGYSPLGNFRGRENLFPLLGILKDTLPEALTAFADKIEPIFATLAQQDPRYFFRLCGQLSSTPDILSQIVSQDTYQQATENHFSTVQFKLREFEDFIMHLKEVPAYRDAARAGIAGALAQHAEADRTDACIAVISQLGTPGQDNQLLADVPANTVSAIARSVEAKAIREQKQPNLMPVVYAFKGLPGLKGLAPKQIQEQIDYVCKDIDRSHHTESENAMHRRDGLRGNLVALTDAALSIPGGKEAVLTPETVQQVTVYVSSASSSTRQLGQEFVGDVCSLFRVLRQDEVLSDCAATRAAFDGIISDGHWGIFPVPNDQGNLSLRVYELAVDGSRTGQWRGDLQSVMRGLRKDGNTDAFNDLKGLLTQHGNSYPTQPPKLRESLAVITKEFC